MPTYDHNGTRVHYERTGEGPPLVLLPGNTESSAVHGPTIERFAREFEVICPDYPGYGRSDRLTELPTNFWWSSAEAVVALMADLDLSDAVLIGVSGGAVVALSATIMAPGRVRAVVADSWFGEFLDEARVHAWIAERDRRDERALAFWRHAHGDDFERVVAADSAMMLAAVEAGGSVCRGRLNEVRCPVLMTGSLSDEVLPDIERGMCAVARQIPTAKVVFVPTGAHPLAWSRPRLFRAEVKRFLADLS